MEEKENKIRSLVRDYKKGKRDIFDSIVSTMQDIDPIETTTSYVWLAIWEWAGSNDCLVPWIGSFKVPQIPLEKVSKCAKEVKLKIPYTSYRDIIKSILEFV